MGNVAQYLRATGIVELLLYANGGGEEVCITVHHGGRVTGVSTYAHTYVLLLLMLLLLYEHRTLSRSLSLALSLSFSSLIPVQFVSLSLYVSLCLSWSLFVSLCLSLSFSVPPPLSVSSPVRIPAK